MSWTPKGKPEINFLSFGPRRPQPPHAEGFAVASDLGAVSEQHCEGKRRKVVIDRDAPSSSVHAPFSFLTVSLIPLPPLFLYLCLAPLRLAFPRPLPVFPSLAGFLSSLPCCFLIHHRLFSPGHSEHTLPWSAVCRCLIHSGCSTSGRGEERVKEGKALPV